jgi:hypothetical protein
MRIPAEMLRTAFKKRSFEVKNCAERSNIRSTRFFYLSRNSRTMDRARDAEAASSADTDVTRPNRAIRRSSDEEPVRPMNVRHGDRFGCFISDTAKPGQYAAVCSELSIESTVAVVSNHRDSPA